MLTSNFVIRTSGVKEGYFYIDFEGEYKVDKIHRITGIAADEIIAIFNKMDAIYNETNEVYYFNSKDKAKEAVDLMVKRIKPAKKVRRIELTEEEIEYIRRALINEDSNIIFTKGKIRDAIFQKLNQ